jgi:short-subunit dehydrogenase
MADSKVILITGASSGIGEASARLFSASGYQVVLAARRIDRLNELAGKIKTGGGDPLVVQADIGKLEQIKLLVESVISHFGKIDILFNNAGLGRMNWLENLDPEGDIDEQIQVNLVGLIQLTQAALPHMIEKRSGHIINMVSLAGFIGTPTYSIYAASKFGVRGFTEALRREVAFYGIRVSAIYPGGVENEFASKTGRAAGKYPTTPAWLRLTSEDVAQAVLKLVKRPRRTVILPWVMGLPVWFNTHLSGLSDGLIQLAYVIKARRKP